MHKIDWLHHTSSRQFSQYIQEIETIAQPFDDEGILAIQDKLLSYGFQYLRVPSVREGRRIVQAFLGSLSYQSIACLTLEENPGAIDLYQILKSSNYLSNKYELQEYFLDHFHFDFMWIEATDELLMSDAFEDIKEAIINCVLDQHMPILVCVYDT